MSKQPLYAVTGLFEEPEKIIHAAETIRDAGYTKFDVHTPYPVHGMDDAMGAPPSKVGYMAFGLGVFGITAMVAFIAWIVLYDYPTVIAGKPYFSLPAYIPPMFEATVFCAGVFGTIGLILFFLRLPFNKHPLHDTAYMEKVSDNLFGLVIEADDPQFDETTTTELLKKLGANHIAPVYYEKKEVNSRYSFMDLRFAGFLVAVFLVSCGGFYLILNQLVYAKPFNWMQHQAKVLPQTKSHFFADGFGMRMPVEGTIAQGYIPYPYANAPEAAGKNLANPLLATEYTLELGRQRYESVCAACHGFYGEGKNKLRGGAIQPPSLHNRAAGWPDGQIYHVITEGQGVMGSYSKQLSREERWAIVHYIRALQQSQNPKE